MDVWLQADRTAECLICTRAGHHTSHLIKSYNRSGHRGIFYVGEFFYANPHDVKVALEAHELFIMIRQTR